MAYLLHQRIFDFFHAHTTHHAFDKRTVGMDGWRLGKKGCKIVFLFDLLLQARLAIASQPTDDLVYFLFRAILAFCLVNV